MPEHSMFPIGMSKLSAIIVQCRHYLPLSTLFTCVDVNKCRDEALNNLLWRSAFDCRRNSVFALAQVYFSGKQLHGLGTTAIVHKLEKEKNIRYNFNLKL